MVESKKVLVAFDPDNPDKQSSDFLVPVQLEDNEMALLGSRSGKLWKYGLVVLTSRAVNKNDLFAKLVDSGQKVPDVEACLAQLESFVVQLKTVKIGNIVSIAIDNDAWRLTVVANTPGGFAKAQN
ncbi:hypothetical protein DTL42_13470 [Bremerella cremea]|uniref:Uncharacterized protein n=1 Tax=Bremerella cremea TaxID=1031537 RepID=A0A368KQI7_9BACT|nr:hypothetical protein [Bremerella cremea]RCS48328.1 hypothetical protein DTL42_13470 [Bremerella cremea]